MKKKSEKKVETGEVKARLFHKRLGKFVLIFLCTLLAIWLLIQLVTTIIFFEFFQKSEKEFRIPGMSDGFVPQGFTYLPEQQVYLICGYMADGESPSRIYTIPKNEPEKAYYNELLKADQTPYTGHTGGIAVKGNYVWLANDGEGEDNCVWVLTIYELFRLHAGESYTLKNSFKPKTRAAYCFVDGDSLWVGEFYRPVDYETDESHTFAASGGKEHHALIGRYTIDETSEIGIVDTTPTAFLSVPAHVQGAERDQYGHFVLSTSYGISKSHFLFYDDVLSNANDAVLPVEGKNVPVWFLDDDVLKRDLSCPPMSEEIVIYNNRVYYLTESASSKYIFGKFIRGRHIYSLPLEH